MQYAVIANGVVTSLSPTPVANGVWCSAAVQVGWQYNASTLTFTPPAGGGSGSSPTALQTFLASVNYALSNSDITMHRIQEAVSLGLTTWTTADVVTYVTYRRSLRALLDSTSAGTLPTAPAYPAGT